MFGLAQVGQSQESVRPLVVLDVPFLTQTEDLCGGAAAAMVLRYWGARDTQAEDFASLVDHAKGGIAAGDLVSALSARGLTPRPIHAEGDDMAREVDASRPVMALIDAGAGRRHFVVIVGWANGRVLFHDPAVGPFRVWTQAEFAARWRATDGFAIALTPTPGARTLTAPQRAQPQTSLPPDGGECAELIDPAIAIARTQDPEAAIPALTAAADLCPTTARALLALAGIRFKQKGWKEAAVFAERATQRDPKDQETWRLLAAALYLDDRPRDALGAWNRIGEPRIDTIGIDGLIRTRQDVAAAALGLHAGEVLTTLSLAHAERRLYELPTSGVGRIAYQSATGGQANVAVSYAESPLIEPWLILVPRLGILAAVRREVEIAISSPSSRGESFFLSWRFAARRPSVSVALATPGLAGLPGVVTLGGLWDRQTYRPLGVDTGLVTEETRRRGSIEWTDWATPSLRASVRAGVDLFDRSRRYLSSGGAVESRLAKDRIALRVDGSQWTSVGKAESFREFGGTVAMRSRVNPRGLTLSARLDARRATQAAPLAIWPGAGEGPGRPLLLRGTHLVDDGYLVGEAFGRGLLHGTVEAEVQAFDRGPLSAGIAAFTDWAKPWDTMLARGAQPSVFSLGLGVRIHGIGKTTIRGDIGFRPGHHGVVFSGGVMAPWPR